MSPNITSKIWRLNNLYKIRDKEGKLITLKLNTSQSKALVKYTHNRKLILKSRQTGISTLYLADNMDDCIFILGFQAGIQSYGREESAKLQKRALLMWDELDPLIKHALGLTLVVKNSSGLEWSNGSILKIGNFRGDTLQSLHISELAKISRKYPDKAEELKSGAFQAVSVSSRITIETTAEGQAGLFPEMWNEAIAMEKAGVPLTALDFQPIFLSWVDDMDCNLYEYTPVTKGVKEYLDILSVELGTNVSFTGNNPHKLKLVKHKTSSETINFTEFQINWLIVKLRQLGDSFNREYPATPELAFAESIDGTYFAVQLADLRDRGGIIPPITLPNNTAVYAVWDLGINDEMVITLWWLHEGIVYLVDEYHNTSLGFEHYLEILDKMPYTYIQHIMPHDIEVREIGTNGRTRRDSLRLLGVFNVVVLDKLSFLESIQVARNLLASELQIFNSCRYTISALQNYRKRFDTKIQAYLSKDVHDIHSNYMASFRYAAQGLTTYLVAKNAKKRENLHKKVYTGLAM